MAVKHFLEFYHLIAPKAGNRRPHLFININTKEVENMAEEEETKPEDKPEEKPEEPASEEKPGE